MKHHALVTLAVVKWGDLASLVSPERGVDSVFLSFRRWPGDASLIQSHVQVPEALHGGGGRPHPMEQ